MPPHANHTKPRGAGRALTSTAAIIGLQQARRSRVAQRLRTLDEPAIAVHELLREHRGAWLDQLEDYANRHLGLGAAALTRALDELEGQGVIVRICTERPRLVSEPAIAVTLRRKGGAR